MTAFGMIPRGMRFGKKTVVGAAPAGRISRPAGSAFQRLRKDAAGAAPSKGPIMMVKPSVPPPPPPASPPSLPAPKVQAPEPRPVTMSVEPERTQLPAQPIQAAVGPAAGPSAPMVVDQPSAAPTPGIASFFDQEMIPGVKNLYLAAAAGGLLLLLLMRKR